MSSLFNRSKSTKAGAPFQDGQPPAALTAAQVLMEIAKWTDLKPAKRSQLASAVNTIVRVAGVPADMLLMTPERLRADVSTPG